MIPKFSRALFKHLVKNNLVLFVEKAFVELYPDARFLPNWHIPALVNRLEQIIEGRSTRLIVNLPPQFLKSMICSVALPAFLLGINPTKRILCVSYSQPLAENFHSAFRRIVEAAWYQDFFRLDILRCTANDFETKQGGRRFATSVNGTLTGFGADLIIVDDPLNAGDAHSKSARDGANNWCTGALISRLSNKNDGAIVVVAQRLHPEDLTGFLLERGGWNWFSLPAIAPNDRSISLLRNRTRLWKKGEALHRELLDLPALAKLKVELGAFNFSAQYLQEPLQSTGSALRVEWIRNYDTEPVREKGDLVAQSWDTAIKPTPSSDYSVCITFLARKNEIYVLNIFRARLGYPDLVRQAVNQANKHQPDVILIEDVQSGSSLVQTLKDRGVNRVIPRKPEKDKETRIARHTVVLEADPLFVPKYASWVEDFRVEFLGFPHARHDDQIDALSQFYQWYDEYLRRTGFSADFDFGDRTDNSWDARLGAPSAAEILGFRGI